MVILECAIDNIYWQCKEGHEWEASICSRTGGSGCPYCAGKRIWWENCLEKKYPNVARNWHPTKNGTLTPRDVASHSSKVVWWQCEHGHEWRRKIAYEINSQGCPYCSGRLACKDNSLAALRPDLAREWDVTKNGSLSPHDVTVKTRKRVWWRCDRGHSWQMNIVHSVAAKKIINIYFDDLITVRTYDIFLDVAGSLLCYSIFLDDLYNVC